MTVHPDHHVSVQYALYSAPSTTCPPGTKLEARCDRALVKLYRAGELVKVHPRKPKGGRSTDATTTRQSAPPTPCARRIA